jgi:hypothetical protein
MVDHSSHTHPATSAARAACRKSTSGAPKSKELYRREQMHLLGQRHSMKDHKNPKQDTLDYWDAKYSGDPYYNDFLDGWTFAATEDPDYAFDPERR